MSAVKTLSSQSRDVAVAIGNRQPFKTYGALRAETVDGLGLWDSGQLSGVDLATFRDDRADIVYVVYSYSTPIAWVKRNDGIYRVRARFSVTTSKHQGKLYYLDGVTS